MDTQSQYPENTTSPAGQPAQGAPVPPAYAPPAYAPEPKKRMSTGSKWAIGIAAAFVVLVIVSCAGSIALLASGDSASFSMGDSIAVIRIDDTISGTSGVTPEDILDQLDQAMADDAVKAIVLRVDSGGGTVAASQEIMMEVRKVREIKPIVVSVGDICASGAYMVASQCDEIVAAPGSSVGSIGVISQVTNVQGLLDKLGIQFTTLTAGEYKDAGSPYRALTETETAMIQEELDAIYNLFIADVAEGRGMTEAEVRELATGWVWLGNEALELGLVDTIGNYNDAIDRAAELGGIAGEPNIVSYEYVDPFSGLLNDLMGLSAQKGLDADALQRSGLPQ